MCYGLLGGTQIRTGDRGFAGHGLTTWLCHRENHRNKRGAKKQFLFLRSFYTLAIMHGAAIDSRLVESGDTFFAITGEKVDGHNFLQEAARRGATHAVVSKAYAGPSFGLQLCFVPAVAWELQERAKHFLIQYPKRVIAISGSVGKTTTKGFAATLLAQKFRVWASPKSYNSQLTLPLSILMADPASEIVILEMGMSEPGQIKRLIDIAPPEVALLTMISLQHVDAFPDGLEGIRREKLSLFAHPKTRLCIHHDSIDWKGGESFTVEDRFGLGWPKPALHNFCAAVALAKAFGVEEIESAIPKLTMPPMRMEEVRRGGILFVNDAYNANPDSMIAALEELGRAQGRKIAVLSEMDALGSFAKQEHERVAKEALKYADLLLCLGGHCVTMQQVWKEAHRPVFYCASKQELRKKLKSVIALGDVVLLKGARAYAMEEILEDY